MQQTQSLHAVEKAIATHAILRSAILDAQDYDGTLVALIHPCVPRKIIKDALDRAWSGEVELYCATDLMVGGQIAADRRLNLSPKAE